MRTGSIGRILQQVGGALSGDARRGTASQGYRTRGRTRTGYSMGGSRRGTAPGGLGRLVSRFLR